MANKQRTAAKKMKISIKVPKFNTLEKDQAY